MKLDPNCVRDILILCEDTPFLSEDMTWEPVSLSYFTEHLPQYPCNQIAYTLYQLDDADYINASVLDGDNQLIDICVHGLTYSGHELIDSIRPAKVWNKIDKTISELSSISLPILQDIGSRFLIDLLTNH